VFISEGDEVDEKQTASKGIEALIKTGADKAQCVASRSQKWELNVEAGEVSLMRTTFDSQVSYTAIKDAKQGISSSNKTDLPSIEAAAEEALEIAEGSQSDAAYDIAEKQPAEVFVVGSSEPDVDLMYDRVVSFIDTVTKELPHTILEQVILSFNLWRACHMNSNEVDFATQMGLYYFSAMFTSKEGKRTSSFNYSGFSTRVIERELLEYGSVRTLLRQSAEQLDLQSIDGKFTGDLIITPDCVSDFIYYFTDLFLSDYSLITGTSLLKDSLGRSVAYGGLTLRSHPVDEELANNYFVTDDGYKAANITILERGVLKSFLLSLYGSRKTGRERALSSGGGYIVDAGDQSYEDLVKGVERGILLCRFSGGHPSDNGDFSGVAKNSYYIEDGEIKYPISETMVSGNVWDVFKNVRGISEERINYGSALLPWVLTSGLTISGK
jgi:PmbA protein